ncbi:hypothetical protein [Marinibactrum halimedae]|uniref:Hydroxymyristoyl-ACP dehydratase n=1 Tax=Marinibactrum halimedae TaxID=1444977 RepID=A0AA37TCS8_9GAMM|nr:hypothetical protein [Marinibactrum halimedae]MCD9460424.1 hypothetical protein [Marinibactrum halimedae]GLS27445.1 hypothetical protein GCM10007877_31640 [Marinibactrum halimedae]
MTSSDNQPHSQSPLTREAIAALLPHGNEMSLIDRILQWDHHRIVCCTTSHLRSDNPLLTDGNTLKTSILMEYAAQAAAVHAGLINSNLGLTRPAYIGAIKNVEWHYDEVPNEPNGVLEIAVNTELCNATGAIYDCTIHYGLAQKKTDEKDAPNTENSAPDLMENTIPIENKTLLLTGRLVLVIPPQ